MYGPPDDTESHPSGGAYERDYATEGGGMTSTYPFENGLTVTSTALGATSCWSSSMTR